MTESRQVTVSNEEAERFDEARTAESKNAMRKINAQEQAAKRKERMRLMVAVPCHDMVPSGFMYDLANMMAFTAANVKTDIELGLSMIQGTYTHTARQDIAKAAIEQAATWVLWLDADMRFPRDTFFRLLKRKYPLIGCNYVTRTVPTNFVAIERVGGPLEEDLDEDGKPKWDKGKRLQTTEESTGVVPVNAFGFGVVLMHTDVLYEMGEKGSFPFFVNGYDFHNKRNVGEDVWFCLKAMEAGFQPLVDQDLSKEIKHIGQIEYVWQHGVDAIAEGWVDEDGHRVEGLEDIGGYEKPPIEISDDIGGGSRGNHLIHKPESFRGRLVEPIGFDCGNP